MSSTAGAQRASDHYWLTGGLSYSRFDLEIGDESREARNGLTIRMGLRICVLCAFKVKRLTITPGLAYGITDIRGLGKDEPYAFSRIDFGAQAAFTIPRTPLRPYVSLWPKGVRTSELAGPTGTVLNYKDSDGKRATTWGIEIPITGELRGLDISITTLKGAFRQREPEELPQGNAVPYSGRIISVGWSGPFTGASLPWR